MADISEKSIATPNIVWEMKRLPPRICSRPVIKKIHCNENVWQFRFECVSTRFCVSVSMSTIRAYNNCPESSFSLRCGWLTSTAQNLMEKQTRASFKDLVNNKSIKIWERDCISLYANLHAIPSNEYYFCCRVELDINIKLKELAEELVPPITSPCLLSLTEDLKNLLETSTMADVVLQCGDKIIPAHKCILSGRSPVFKAMFKNDFKESVQGTVDITDIAPTVFQILIDYVYTGNIDMNDVCVELACELFKAADKYCISLLKERCVKFIKENIEPHHASTVLFMSHLYGHTELKTYVISYLGERKEILISEDWRKFAEQNLALAQEVFLHYIKEN